MKKKKQNQQTVPSKKSRKPLYAAIGVGMVFIAIIGKFIAVVGVVSIIGFTSGKVVKRLNERKNVSC